MLKSFEPIVNQKTTRIVVGTMPGIASLEVKEYYAHPRNAFWKIMAELFNGGAEFADYDSKKRCALEHGVGIWDSLQFCQRIGSLDSNITDEVPNDFPKLLAANPQVCKLLFNGQNAYKFFKKYHQDILKNIGFEILPSTSPANATKTFSYKLEVWGKALK